MDGIGKLTVALVVMLGLVPPVIRLALPGRSFRVGHVVRVEVVVPGHVAVVRDRDLLA